MTPGATRVQRIYLTLILGNTLAASFIWGINTIFLLDAGLSNFEAFAANAFFTAGMVIFEIPTGVVADTVGRKVSYLLGTVTLSVTTGLYWLLWLLHSPFFWWAIVSVLLGLGFTFFSGAVEAWLVDALNGDRLHRQPRGRLRPRPRRHRHRHVRRLGTRRRDRPGDQPGCSVPGPRCCARRDVRFRILFYDGSRFHPDHSRGPIKATRPRALPVRRVRTEKALGSVHDFLRAVCGGVGIYAFYALQPYLLEIYGDTKAYSIAGLAAAVLSLAQIAGGVLAPRVRGLFARRTSTILGASLVSILVLVLLGVNNLFWLAIALLVVWGFVFAVAGPVRQGYVNDMIPSQQRATVLSFDSLFGSLGGVFIQPALGRAADLGGYGFSLAIGGVVQLVALPFLFASRRQRDPADLNGERGRPAAAAKRGL